MGALIAVSKIGYCNVEIWGYHRLLAIWSKICQYPSGISGAGKLFLGCPKEAGIILTMLPRSKTLGVLYSITSPRDLGSDDLI